MRAYQVIGWIDWARGNGELPADRERVPFLRLHYAGRWFLGSIFAIAPIIPPRWWADVVWDDPNWWSQVEQNFLARVTRDGLPMGWFVMEEKACFTFLNALAGMIRDGREQRPKQLELPAFDPIGFGVGGDEGSLLRTSPDYSYALFRDGLALIGDPFDGVDLRLRAGRPTKASWCTIDH